ncbi:MAG TPA: hypothetical protein VGJ17_07040 [Candidatus Limnocylindrales bacterium]
MALVALLVAGWLAGCIPQVNAIVEVFNETGHSGTLDWQGTSTGAEAIAPCSSDTLINLGRGYWQVTIAEGSDRLATSVTAPATGSLYEVYEIGPGGEISHLYSGDQHGAPARPAGWAFCMGQ